jgi:hypothetical protein
MQLHQKQTNKLETEEKMDPGKQERIRAHVAALEMKDSVRTKEKKDRGEQ